MTPIQVMAAYKAIHELANCVLPYKITRQVHALKKSLVEEFDVILSTERSMVEKHGGTSQRGTYNFDSTEQAEAFHEEYDAYIHKESDDIKLPHADVSKCTDAIRISSAAIEALEGLVDFGEV